jgi:hypothetical protein
MTLVIITGICALAVLFLLRFLVALCGKDGRGNHVVHVLHVEPEHDGCGGNETDSEIAVEDVNQYMPHRRMAPVFAAKLMTRRDSDGTRGLTAVQRMKSPTQGRTSEAGKSTR